MKTAEQMFADLGYVFRCPYGYICYAKYDKAIRKIIILVFDLEKKDFHCKSGKMVKTFNEKEQQAIQKQKEELGWVEKGASL